RDDVVPLARKFLAMFVSRMKKPTLVFARETERMLAAYDYPGNVRELKNLVERAVILSTGETIGSDNIVLSGPSRDVADSTDFFSVELDAAGQRPSLERLEALYIAKLLAFAQGNRTQVARLLGVSYPTIAKKIADYGLAKDKG